MVNRDAAVSETSPRGTGCGKSARPGLWGARVATSSPTRRHQGRLRPVFDGAIGAGQLSASPCDQRSAVPTPSALSIARPRGHGARDRVCGAAIRCSACAFAHPTKNLSFSFLLSLFLLYSLLPFHYHYSLFLFATPMRGGGAPTAARVQRHPRPAITLQARHPPGCLPPSAEGGAPLGAPPWRFWAGGRASFSGISSGSVQRAPRSQVIVPGGRDPGPLQDATARRSLEPLR